MLGVILSKQGKRKTVVVLFGVSVGLLAGGVI